MCQSHPDFKREAKEVCVRPGRKSPQPCHHIMEKTGNLVSYNLKETGIYGVKFIPTMLLLSVHQWCLILCDSMDYSTPGFPVLHYLPEFAQTLVH